MELDIKHASNVAERNWERARLETSPQKGALKLVLGPYCNAGVTKECPIECNGLEVALRARDATSMVEASSSETNFSRRNVATHGIDVLFCEAVGCKTWVRHGSIRANKAPLLVNLLQSTRTESNDDTMNGTSASETTSLVEPGISMFFFIGTVL